MKLHPICILKYQKIQCYRNAADFMLVQAYGEGYPFLNVNVAQIARMTTKCSDNQNLHIRWQSRDVMNFEFHPETQTIDLHTELLYPDAAFGSYNDDGVIYQKLDYETVLLHFYEGGSDVIAELAKKVAANGEDIYDILFEPEHWKDMENIADAYCDPIR